MLKNSTAVKQLDPANGRDEMNLAEFPISLLSNREPDDHKPLVFEGKHGRLTISGSEGPREKGNGLPTASDTDVLIGLLQLTKRANDFTDPTVAFSRYELLKIIRWPDEGKSYKRLAAALNRWTGVKLHYEKSWYDKQRKCRVDAIFHILESVIIYDRSAQPLANSQDQDEQPCSTFSWNKVFFRSCQAGNLKRLNLDVYFSLESPITKQLYRFLDKNFYDHETLTFELRELAVGHVGMSANYTIPRIKEKLAPCLEELERIGLIEPMVKEQRYSKLGHGKWNITFRRKARERGPLPEVIVEPETPLVQELINRGITPITAKELHRTFPAEAVSMKLEVFDWLMAKKDKRISKNPAGYLAKSIRDDFATPQGFKSKTQVEAERLAAEKVEEDVRARKAEARATDTRLKAEGAAIDAHLANLTLEQRAQLEQEAFAASELNAKLFGKVIVREHVRKLLGFSTEN
jgi:hypothetical protein